MIRLQKIMMAGVISAAIMVTTIAPVAALAQDAVQGTVARPVVQALPDPVSMRLTEVLRALSRDPQSLPLVLEAAEASLKLGNRDAAEGFYKRAEALSPSEPRLKAGRASMALQDGNALDALRLFDEAERGGAPMEQFGAYRGLAYDLVGDNSRAQAEYRRALSQSDDSAVTMRLAISQAIAGNQAGAEATLLPLLQRSDLAAFRARAFALAIMGQEQEAVTIAETMLPERISSRMAPYLRYMPRLTRAQQAAAANLGRFPRASDIGQDEPGIAAYLASRPGLAASSPAPRPVQTADARLVPSGAPLGQAAPRVESTPVVQALPAPATGPAPVASASPRQAAAVASATLPMPAPIPSITREPAGPPPGQPVVVARMETPAPVPAVAAAPVPVSVTTPASAFVPASSPVAVAAEPDDVPEPRDLALAFSDFAKPMEITIAPGAVDISRIEVKRETPPPKVQPKPAPPPKPVIPSRHWVQVATGRNTDALAFDWRRISRSADGLLRPYKPQVARWGQTNRLLVGPFDTTKEADQFLKKLKEKELDSFRFTSDEGEEVKALP